ncbi:hypothetical protein VP01_1225g11 [Puccinia sorghi]|uniref:Uncharacterized protein n=1 Tax=Puccinia sorghi TaxID=27349 RepID=A0A0L6VRF0_9BASI|nr:hypothetical protein VP01_1225g11 [Puccinia sorghi]
MGAPNSTDLSGHPRIHSTWTRMQSFGNDHAFINLMGLNCQTFE